MNWSHIDTWLSTLYNNKEIPFFERTNKNFEILNNLKKLNFNSTKLVENIIINTVEIDTSLLTLEGRNALDSLGHIAHYLGIDQTQLSNYYTAVAQLSMDKMKTDLQLQQLDEIDLSLNHCNEELLKIQGVLARLQEENRDVNKNEQMITQMETDQSEYLFLEKKYNNLGIRTRLSHLYELDSTSDSIEKNLLEKTNVLTSFQILPPDMKLASLKILETEQHLHELEAQREDLLIARF